MLVLKGPKRPVKSLAFSPDGSLLASAGEVGCVRLWGALDGRPVNELEDPERWASDADSSVVFAPDGRLLVVTSMKFKVTVWDVQEGKVAARLVPGSIFMCAPTAAFAADGRLLALRSDAESGLFAWDPATWQPLPVVWSSGEGEYGNAMALEPGGRRAALENGLLIDTCSGAVLGRWGERVNAHWVRGGSTMAWCPNKPLLAFRSGARAIDVVNPLDTKLVIRLTVSKKHVEGFLFTPDGGHLIVACNDKAARLYDVGTWSERQTLDWGIGGLRSVAVAADGSRAAAGSAVSTYSGKIVIWDLD